MENIEIRVKEIVKKQLNLSDGKEISNDSSFIEDLNANFEEIIKLFTELGKEFKISMNPAIDEDAENLTTVGLVIEHIKKNSK